MGKTLKRTLLCQDEDCMSLAGRVKNQSNMQCQNSHLK